MSYACPNSVQACVLRITEENECGVSLDPLTPNSRLQITEFTSIAMAWDVEEGARILQKDACDRIVTNFRGQDRTKGINITLTLPKTMSTVLEMLLGGSFLEDPDSAGDFRGYVLPNDLTATRRNPVMLEAWSLNENIAACGLGGSTANAYVHHLLPRVDNWQLTDTKNIDATSADVWMLTGYAQYNPNWFPSYPGSDFPSWDPGGGSTSPDNIPDGPAPAVLPSDATADEWTLDDQTAIQAGGPYAYLETGTIPTAGGSCQFFPDGS